MKVKIDLHNHGPRKGNWQEGDFERVFNSAYNSLGDGGVFGITEMGDGFDNRYSRFLDLWDKEASNDYSIEEIGGSSDRVVLSRDSQNLVLVRTNETRTNHGHILFFGLEDGESVKNGEDSWESIRRGRDLGGRFIINHPFAPGGLGKYLSGAIHEEHPEVLEDASGYEYYNASACIFPFANSDAKHFYENFGEEYEFGRVSFTDGHGISILCSPIIGRANTSIIAPGVESQEIFDRDLEDGIRGTGLGDLNRRKNFLDSFRHCVYMLKDKLP